MWGRAIACLNGRTLTAHAFGIVSVCKRLMRDIFFNYTIILCKLFDINLIVVYTIPLCPRTEITARLFMALLVVFFFIAYESHGYTGTNNRYFHNKLNSIEQHAISHASFKRTTKRSVSWYYCDSAIIMFIGRHMCVMRANFDAIQSHWIRRVE